MQPFDLKHFSVYKKYGPEYWWQPEDADDEKMDWLSGFGSMREENMTPAIIKRAFADQGIFPFDPFKLTGPLREDKTKESQFEQDSEWVVSPPIISYESCIGMDVFNGAAES